MEATNKINKRAHRAGLKRLSARANASAPSSSASSASSSSASASSSSSSSQIVFSFSQYGKGLLDHLRKCNVFISSGLTEEEFGRIEASFGFTFPPDLRGILQEGLPIACGFPDWRSQSSCTNIRKWLSFPVSVFCKKVEKGKFWWKQWGCRPFDTDQALLIARASLRKCPILVPLFDHFYVAASPNRAGNPVFLIREEGEIHVCARDVGHFFQKGFSPSESSTSFSTDHELPVYSEDDWRRSSSSCSASRSSSSIDNERSRSPMQEIVESYESWGRNLDALAKNTDALLMLKKGSSFAAARNIIWEFVLSWDSSFVVSGFEDDDKKRPNVSAALVDLNLQQLPSQCLLDSDNSAGKPVRRIEFWSDLVERQIAVRIRQQQQEGQQQQQQQQEEHQEQEQVMMRLHSSVVVSLTHEGKNRELQERNDDERAAAAIVEAEAEVTEVEEGGGGEMGKWVWGVLSDIAEQLRNGGWREDDITEMVDASSPKSVLYYHDHYHHHDEQQQEESVIDELASKIHLLSNSLKQAGWTVEEISDALSMC